MTTILTLEQMVQSMIDMLEKAVEDLPEEDQERTKAKILDAFGAALFQAPMKERDE